MGILQDIVDFFRGGRCHFLIRREGNEFAISALTVKVGPVDISLGSFSNKIKSLNRASRVAISLDNAQYLFCDEIDRIEDPEYRVTVRKARLMMIAGFTQLSIIIDAIIQKKAASKELNQELVDWIKFMNELIKKTIGMLSPQQRERAMPSLRAMVKNAPKGRFRDNKIFESEELLGILNYLKIDVQELDRAARELEK